MEKTKGQHRKQFVTNSFKYLLVVSSLAGTLGIWNLLANEDLVNADTKSINNETSASTIDQDPLPTLVPLQKVDLSQIRSNGAIPGGVQTTSSNPLREVARPTSAPVVQPSTPLILDSSASNSSGNQNSSGINPQAPAANPPAPVTTTQSSKP